MYRALPFERLVPLYELADVALVTPLRDGMNLIAKEYLAARSDGSGVLILSETAGAAEELGEAVIVNPHDIQGMVKALDQALNMPFDEQRQRNQPMLGRLRRYGTIEWANDFLNQLTGASGSRNQVHQIPLKGEVLNRMLSQYQMGEKRILFLDYDGTLVPFTSVPSKAVPDPELLDTLKSLSEDNKNRIAIISGRDCQTLQEWLGETNATLIAEHGACTRIVGEREWSYLEEVRDQSWKDHIRPVMQIYVDRTPGAILEEKSSSLAWHYRRAEPDLGSLRAKELIDTLEGYIANTSLQVLQGSRVIEVRHSAVSKGRAAQRFLQDNSGADFVLAAGDDTTDEDLFNVIPEDQWTIKVREQDQSIAQYSLPNTVSVRMMLKRLAEADRI
jgi:trehalose 6-phosphate synthase/phosphatase